MIEKKQKGFTLIELLVVIAVISLLASIVIVAMNNSRQKARMAKLAADFHQIQKQADAARHEQNLNFGTITGQWCSPCQFTDGLAITDPSHAAALASQAAGWTNLGFKSAPKDPWGNPYILEGNEYEAGWSGGPCSRWDLIISGGPDGIEQWDGSFEDDPPGKIYTSAIDDNYYYPITRFQCTN